MFNADWSVTAGGPAGCQDGEEAWGVGGWRLVAGNTGYRLEVWRSQSGPVLRDSEDNYMQVTRDN